MKFHTKNKKLVLSVTFCITYYCTRRKMKSNTEHYTEERDGFISCRVPIESPPPCQPR